MRFNSALLVVVLWPIAVFGQVPAPAAAASSPSEADTATTVFEHPASGRFWVSGQINVIGQGHSSFRAEYSGPNSLKSKAEFAVSNLLTLDTGLELNKTTEVIFDIESAGGHGISDALGLGGFTNLDVVRSPDLGQTPYLARFMIHKVIDLGGGEQETERGPFGLATELPARRIDLRAGKFSLVDFFDLNAVGSDSHLQFLNWTDDNNGAYDYAANTRGYTWGAIAEYYDKSWALRFAEAMMPKVANGPNLDADLLRAHAENLELELHRAVVPHRAGTLRLLSYVNHANMGSYRDAIGEFRAGKVSAPDVTATRRQGRVKYGFGVNFEQPITDTARAFMRFGWSDGRNESFAYTEDDRTAAFGADLRGDAWRRKLDKVGGAFVANGLSGDHREYLALGGLGFVLGDGKLTYGRERIFEGYYTAHLWRGVFGSLDIQHVTNPGYNRDRGPVLVPALRLHIDF
ncbi:MAG TPA: carbohydrate porin [Terriglobia bacterium]|nr:carbohydrate porin [Terriglobia bacterium]